MVVFSSCRVTSIQNELGNQILSDFKDAVSIPGIKVLMTFFCFPRQKNLVPFQIESFSKFSLYAFWKLHILGWDSENCVKRSNWYQQCTLIRRVCTCIMPVTWFLLCLPSTMISFCCQSLFILGLKDLIVRSLVFWASNLIERLSFASSSSFTFFSHLQDLILNLLMLVKLSPYWIHDSSKS